MTMSAILMVEDDPIQMDLYLEVLSPDYHMLTAHSISDAISAIADHAVHAVGCDYHLIDGSGLELVAWIDTHRPELLARTVLITGELTPPLNGHDVRLLYKPVPIDTLLGVFEAWSPAPGGAGGCAG